MGVVYTPFEITQGTVAEWEIPVGDYSGYTATLTIISPSGSLSSLATESDGEFCFALTAAQTEDLHIGSYRFQVALALADDKHILESGYIYVRENVAQENPLAISGKSPARQRYEHYNALLLNEAFVKSLAPGQIEELEQSMKRLEWDIKREEDSEKMARGINATRKLYTRFV